MIISKNHSCIAVVLKVIDISPGSIGTSKAGVLKSFKGSVKTEWKCPIQ